jgi:hypothetical protein
MGFEVCEFSHLLHCGRALSKNSPFGSEDFSLSILCSGSVSEVLSVLLLFPKTTSWPLIHMPNLGRLEKVT